MLILNKINWYSLNFAFLRIKEDNFNCPLISHLTFKKVKIQTIIAILTYIFFYCLCKKSSTIYEYMTYLHIEKIKVACATKLPIIEKENKSLPNRLLKCLRLLVIGWAGTGISSQIYNFIINIILNNKLL